MWAPSSSRRWEPGVGVGGGGVLITLVWGKSEVFSFLALWAPSHLLLANAALRAALDWAVLLGS